MTYITLTNTLNPRRPKVLRVRADQIQIFYVSSRDTHSGGPELITEVEIVGRPSNLIVVETPEEITALLAGSTDLLHEIRALRHQVEQQRAGAAIRTAPPHTDQRNLARLLVAVWMPDMQQHLAVGEVANFLRMQSDDVRALYKKAQELAK